MRGLNYQSLKWVIEMYAPENAREMFEAIGIMEGAALDMLNRHAD